MLISRIATCLCLSALCGTGVMATELPSGKAAGRGFANACAGYGPGFVPVAGTGTCARVAGHVRVEYGMGSAGPSHGHGPETGMSSYLPADPLGGDNGFVFGRLKPSAPKRAEPLRPYGTLQR